MSEQVVVICSEGEQLLVMDLCAKLEGQGLTCWSPVREEDPDAAIWTLPSKLRSARVMVILTNGTSEFTDTVKMAESNKVPVIRTGPEGAAKGWTQVMQELGAALGISPDWLSSRNTASRPLPKTHIADDEEEFLEFIAENVSEAQVFLRFGLFERAVERLKRVFSKAPRNLEAHDELLKIFLEEEDWRSAAGVAADFLDCLRYRDDDESYAILRTHLVSMGFVVEDGPPVAVGYSDVEPVPTKFVDKSVKPAAVQPPAAHPPAAAAPAPAAPSSSAGSPAPSAPSPPAAPKGVEPIPLELPALRNFRATNPVFQSTGIESELSGIDFFIDHGMLDEARMRLDQLAHENPDHAGVKERMSRIREIGMASLKSAIALELDDPWDAAKRAPQEAPVDAYFDSGASATAPPPAEPAPFAEVPESPVAGPIGEGDSLVCTAFVPESVEPGDMFIIRVCVHRPDQSDHPMLESHHDRRESNMLARNIATGHPVVISLNLPGFEIDGDRFQIGWAGEPDSVEFSVVVPFAQDSGTVTGVLSVMTDAGPAGEFSLSIPVS